MAGLRFVRPVLLAVAFGLLGAGAASAGSTYVNPFTAPSYFVGRTDMGVDLCLNAGDAIAAVGNGVVVGIQHDWFEKQPYIWYELTSGPDAGRYVYVAEQITHLAKVGQQLSAGDAVAVYAKKGTCIETGWSAPTGATLAQTTTGYHEGDVTAAGISFAHFLISLGVQGQFELTVPKAQTASKKKTVKKTTTTATTTTSKSTTTTTSSKSTTTTTTTSSHTPRSQSGGSSGIPPASSGGAASYGGGSSSGGASGGTGWS